MLMKPLSLRNALLGGVVGAALGAAPAMAIPIQVAFNFVPTGVLTANTGDVTTATTITPGSPLQVGSIILNNIGVVTGQAVTLTDPTPIVVGNTFTKTFTTSFGSFSETLTVTNSPSLPNSRGVLASGTIIETVHTTGPVFDPTPVFYSAAYTQNGGPGQQINGSFNDSTTPIIPPNIPEPASLALLGVGLVRARCATSPTQVLISDHRSLKCLRCGAYGRRFASW
jgi:hypothetical protein